MVSDTQLQRFTDARERGNAYYCPGCWNGQDVAGKCSACRRFVVWRMPEKEPVGRGLRQAWRGPFITQPQSAWLAENAYRRRRGLSPLAPVTVAQAALRDGRTPVGPGGAL